MNGKQGNTSAKKPDWHEIFRRNGSVRPPYEAVLKQLQALPAREVRTLSERMEATFREMGVTFNVGGPEQAWVCDLLPQVFTREDWDIVDRGFRQRLRAFELFLSDVYGAKEILRAGVVPVQAVLGSPHYQRASMGLGKPGQAFLHLSGVCLVRDRSGTLMVKHHHFAHASGLSYMMQNRRALARVIPELFQDEPVQALADAPLAVLETLRNLAETRNEDLSVVLLSPGPGSAVYSEHSFLARRMGIPVVQGGDLLVLDDCVYLKTVQGLERVEVIYNRLADEWLDPLVFRRDSLIGIPGLVHCLRKGSVILINGIGSQLADDRSLLHCSSRIIRFYLNEEPVLPTVPTFWLGDIDQREMVLGEPHKYQINPLFADGLSGAPGSAQTVDPETMRRDGRNFVAQPVGIDATTACIGSGLEARREQEHIVFALRQGKHFEVFPGALTRVAPLERADFEGAWSSRDTWVLGDGSEPHLLTARTATQSPSGPVLVERKITSRVAESFYWMGRYLERAYHQAYLIQAVETLETEELNSAERKLYRPMWNRLLPPIEKSSGTSRRSITNRQDRYRLLLLREPGSVVSTFERAFNNAASVLECLSPEAWAILSDMHQRFERLKYKQTISEEECARIARPMSELVTRTVPQFFATANATMLADDGWRFCEIGQMLERAVITANSLAAISKPLTGTAHSTEIELSAFLRLLGSRDAYRRVYQTRAEPMAVLEFLWQNAQAPRSVLRCLQRCASLLRDSAPADYPETAKALLSIDDLCQRLRGVDWSSFVGQSLEDLPAAPAREQPPSGQLGPLLTQLLELTMDIHQLISDGFLSHQAVIAESVQSKSSNGI